MNGFVAMPRGWMDNPVFGSVKREPFSRHAAWAWLVENAAYKPSVTKFGSKTIEVRRGQLSTSLLHLGGVWGWNTMKVARFITLLQRSAMADSNTDKGRTLLTICNYDSFCSAERNSDTPTVVTPEAHRAATVTVLKKEQTSPRGEVTTTRATRLPADFVMPLDWLDDGRLAREKASLPPADLATEALKFVNHFLSKAGREGAKLDWHRTWINWCLNTKGSGNGSRFSAREPAAVAHDRAIDILGQAVRDRERPGYRSPFETPH